MRLELLPYLIISSLGLGLNTIIGSIIIFGLRVNSSELTIALLISIIDSIFYINNIIHSIYAADKPIIDEIYTTIPAWFSNLNLVITVSSLLSSIGLVTILSVMRYIKICLCKKISGWIWISISLLLVCLSFTLCFVNIQFYTFICSSTNFYCGPNIRMNIEDGTPNLTYLKLYSMVHLLGVLFPLPIIAFCYIKVTSTYYTVVKPHFLNNLTIRRRTEISCSPCSLNQFLIQYEEEVIKRTKQKIKKKRINTIIKISLIMIAYMACFLSEFVLALIAFAQNDLSLRSNVITNSLVCCAGLVSASFILLVNVQVQNIVKSFLKALFGTFHS